MLLFIVVTYAQNNLAQATIQGVLQGNQGQVIQLAEAFSEDQYDWRPAEGVNSVGEALLHVAGGNYFLAMKMGFPPPEDVDMMSLGKITGKDNIIAKLPMHVLTELYRRGANNISYTNKRRYQAPFFMNRFNLC